MPWPKCNQTDEREQVMETDLSIGITFHHLGLILSAACSLLAVVLSFYLMWRHATHYLKPYEQKHIIRILLMVPIYAVVSFLSFYYYRHSIYFQVIRDCYEAIAIASFFTLLCHYVAPDLHSQKDYFRTLKPKPWLLPLNWFARCCGGQRGIWRVPRSGLTWFNIVWICVFQYCFVRVFMTIISVVSQAFDKYCLESLNPAFAHVWAVALTAVGVTIAMYCLIQFYYQLRDDLADHKPFLKLLAIKLVIFLAFWQTIIIDFLTSTNVINSTPTIGQPDIKIGIPSMLLCIEMALFSILHLFAYPWKPYDIRTSSMVVRESGPGYPPDPETAYQGGVFGWRAYLDALNMFDLVRGVGRSARWLFVGRKHREDDISYKDYIDSSVRPKGLGKPSSYVRLDNDSEERFGSTTQLKPLNLQVEAGDIGTARFDAGPHVQPNANTRTGDIGTARFATNPYIQPSPNARTEYGIEAGTTDTGYHGASFPSREEWAAGQGRAF